MAGQRREGQIIGEKEEKYSRPVVSFVVSLLVSSSVIISSKWQGALCDFQPFPG